MPPRSRESRSGGSPRGTRTDSVVPLAATGARTACTLTPRSSRTSTQGTRRRGGVPPARSAAPRADVLPPRWLAMTGCARPGSPIDEESALTVDEEVGDAGIVEERTQESQGRIPPRRGRWGPRGPGSRGRSMSCPDRREGGAPPRMRDPPDLWTTGTGCRARERSCRRIRRNDSRTTAATGEEDRPRRERRPAEKEGRHPVSGGRGMPPCAGGILGGSPRTQCRKRCSGTFTIRGGKSPDQLDTLIHADISPVSPNPGCHYRRWPLPGVVDSVTQVMTPCADAGVT